MATYVVYARLHFNNRRQRDTFRADVEREALARGFRNMEAYEDYPAGAANFTTPNGDTGLSLCYMHTDYALVEEAAALLEASAGRNGRRGDEGDVFGTGMVRP